MQMFVHTWDRVESVRPSLRKLCRFWTEVKELDQGVVAQCQMYTLPYGGGMPPVPAPTASPGAARFAVNMPGPGYGVQQRGVSQMVTVPAPSASYIAIPSQPMIAQQPSSYMRSGHYATGMAAQQLPATSLPQVLYPPGSVQTQPILYPGKGVQQAAYMQPLHNMHAGQAQMPMGGTARDLQAHASAPRKRSTVFPPSHVLKVNALVMGTCLAHAAMFWLNNSYRRQLCMCLMEYGKLGRLLF